MNRVPTQSEGNIAKPVRVRNGLGLRPNRAGKGAMVVPTKRISLPKFTIPKI